MNRRAGVTLIEVLIAIFVVALGLLALLTLFPLGALSMAQAIKDDRVALTAANATATLKAMNVTADTNVIAALTQNQKNLLPNRPGYATFFDPIGHHHYSGVAQTQVGAWLPLGVPASGVWRCTSTWIQTNFIGTNRNAVLGAWFTSPDDLTFTSDSAQSAQLGVAANDFGQAAAVAGGSVQRAGAYSWGAMLRRPYAYESPTEVSIVVFRGRSTELTAALGPASERPFLLASIPAAGSNVVTINFSGAAPDIRVGSWILDTTNSQGHGDFYRVTGVTVNGTTADLELQTPIKVAGCSQVAFMDNVAEVVYKGVIGP